MKAFLAGILLAISSVTLADIPKYYGYDWLDDNWNVIPTTRYNQVKEHTNLNVVHSITALNSKVCKNNTCALNVRAGHSDVYVDICPNKTSDSDCIKESYQNIWGIVNKISTAINKPSVVYLIDEPFYESALKQNNNYVQFRFASYVCTMNEALTAYGLSIPVMTILSDEQYKNSTYKNEILNGIPSTGCSAGVKSVVDWIGIDNYTWTNKQQVLEAYNYLDPTKKFKWVLVPASTYDVANEAYMIDFYKESAEIANNFVYIMNFRYDSRMFGSGKQSELNSKSFGMFIKNLHK